MSLEERKEVRGIVGAILVGALNTSVVGGLRQISVDDAAVMVKGFLVGDMLGLCGSWNRFLWEMRDNCAVVPKGL